MVKISVKRSIKSGLLSGKKFEISARVESEDGKDLTALFKGYADEHVLAYKSAFTDKPVTLRRSELVRGTRFAAGSLNEVIEFEDNLKLAAQHFRRMLEIVEMGDADIAIEP